MLVLPTSSRAADRKKSTKYVYVTSKKVLWPIKNGHQLAKSEIFKNVRQTLQHLHLQL